VNNINADKMLAEMRAMAFEARRNPAELTANDTTKIDFSNVLRQAIDNVNAVQKNAGALKKAFEKGEPGLDLTQVMVASQKASIAFKAALEVRNKLIKAYQDIISMPV